MTQLAYMVTFLSGRGYHPIATEAIFNHFSIACNELILLESLALF